jgi:ribulose-5-phosphate 4-epimerase/fuculose-1-phosphate aldolase
MKRGRAAGSVAVFFVTHLSRPVSEPRLARLLGRLGAPVVRRALANLRDLRRRHPDLAVISVRELLAGTEADLRIRVLKLFSAAGALQSYGVPESPGARAKQPPLPYGGPWPRTLKAPEAAWFFTRMQEIQATAAAVLRAGLAVSSTHIVISARRGRFMTITASDTDKSQVRLFSHTPLVTQASKRFVYYGDKGFPPSSETASHWHLHQALASQLPRRGEFLVHFHHDGLRAAARPGKILTRGLLRIPCIAPLRYGSRAQGLAMAAAMRRAGSSAVTIAHHGTWFTGASFAEALRTARQAVRALSDKSVC